MSANSWHYRKTAIVESDDTEDRWSRNGINFLFYWKAKYPKFKITLFTIPDRTSREMLSLLSRHSDWIELAVHGFNHDSNYECYEWSEETAGRLLDASLTKGPFTKIFKAPGWTITPGYNGYPASESLPLHSDPQAVYRALAARNFIVVDRHYNAPGRPEGLKVVCIDDNPDIVHMHTWPMPTGEPKDRNGYQQVEEEHGVPWDHVTEFYFMSEAWEKGLIQPCQR